jgi:hypothetical protein
VEFVAGFVAGGLTIVGGMAFIARVILTSPVLLRAVEALAASWPAEVRDALGTWGRLVIKATNDVPDEPEK